MKRFDWLKFFQISMQKCLKPWSEEPCATEFLPFAPSHCSKQAGSLWVARWHQLHRHITSWKRLKGSKQRAKAATLEVLCTLLPHGKLRGSTSGHCRTLHCGWIQHPWKHYDYVVQYTVYVYIYMNVLYKYIYNCIHMHIHFNISIHPYTHISLYP